VRLAGALLAAGGSTRLGRAKAFLELGGETFLARLARELAAIASPVIVVVPPRSPAYGRTVEACGARAVVNPNPARGMGSSLAVAAAALRPWAPDADALLVALVDQPLADRELFARLRDATAAGLGFAASDYGDGALGPPAVFPRTAFPALRALTGDRDARALLERAGDRVARVPFPGGRFDVDTAADYARLLAESDPER
jgi:CTP:molybdopterin cytidylyltransferase MocA